MGENALYNGQQVKIGTCENMYYLRADQAHLVKPLRGNVNPVKDAAEIRFRFPFPGEDDVEPGGFDNAFATFPVAGLKVPEGVSHSTVQFKAENGYLLSLPCPEGPDAPEGVHRNGYTGAVKIVQQRVLDGMLVLVCKCGGCGALYRAPTLEDAQPVIDSLRAQADGNYGHPTYRVIADRIEAGYTDPPALAR
jgi:hypothetical protein